MGIPMSTFPTMVMYFNIIFWFLLSRPLENLIWRKKIYYYSCIWLHGTVNSVSLQYHASYFFYILIEWIMVTGNVHENTSSHFQMQSVAYALFYPMHYILMSPWVVCVCVRDISFSFWFAYIIISYVTTTTTATTTSR